jgi:RNA polymerase sigma-70 factor (ECF subfamily)
MTETPEQSFARFRRSGDAAALVAAFDATAPELLRVAAFLLPRDEVEDALHDTFVIAMARSERFREGEPLLPWLLGILANEARMRRRRRRQRERPLDLPVPPAAEDPAAAAAAREVAQRVESALGELPRDDSALLRLHLFDELSCREIGDRLQRNQGTVRTQVARAMSRLRQRLPALAGAAPFDGAFGSLFRSLDATTLAAVRDRVLDSAARAISDGGGTASARLLRRTTGMGAAAAALVVLAGAITWLAWPSSPERDAQDRVAAAESPRPVPPQPGTNNAAGHGSDADRPLERTVADTAPARWQQHGRVHDPDGKPIAAARVVLRRGELEPALAQALADDDGRYTLDVSFWQRRPALDRRQAGLFTTVSARGYHSRGNFGKFPDDADPALPVDVACDFELSVYPTLHGRVVDRDGKPVAAMIKVLGPAGDTLDLSHAEADGMFHIVLAGIDEGDVVVDARHATGQSQQVRVHVATGTGADVGTLQLAGGYEATGTVTLGDGSPLAGWKLWAGSEALRWYVEPETDERGRFCVFRPAATPWSVHVRGVYGLDGTRNAPDQQVAADASDVQLVVDGALIHLRWFDPAGSELLPQSCSLDVFRPDDAHLARAAQRGDAAAAEKAILQESTRDAYTIVPAGSHLWLRSAARGGLQVDEVFDVPAGGVRHEVALRYRAVPRAELEVQVRFQDGTVPAAFSCRARSRSGSAVGGEELARAPGSCRMMMPLGDVEVTVSAYPEHLDGGEETRAARVEATGANVCEVVLQRRGRFALLLRDAAQPDRFDQNSISARVTAGGEEIGLFQYEDGDSEMTSSEPPIGRRAETLTLLPVGRHRVDIAVEGFEPVTAFVDIAADQMAEVAVLLTRKPAPARK